MSQSKRLAKLLCLKSMGYLVLLDKKSRSIGVSLDILQFKLDEISAVVLCVRPNKEESGGRRKTTVEVK